MSINRYIASGNLTADPETFVTNSGSCVLKFTVAVNDRRQDRDTGEWGDYPNFIDCKFFGNRAKGVSTFLAKGMKVCVEGKLRQERWQGENGQRSRLLVYVDDLEIMTIKSEDKPQPATSVYEEEIPF